MASSPVSAQDPDQAWLLSEGVRARLEFGLPATSNGVAQLMGSVSDVGSEEWGFPMTAAEAKAVDVGGRMKYESEFDESVVKFVRSLPTYAGVSFDQRDGGRPTVRLTHLDEATVTAIRDLDPDPTRGMRVLAVKTSYWDLVAAAERGEAALRAEDRSVPFNGVGVDVLGNRVRFYVDPGFIVDPGIQSRLEHTLGVDVTFAAKARANDTACTTNRSNCANPMKAGIRIDRGNVGNAWWCSLGWIVSDGADEQFLTAGHCGYGTPHQWYHGGYGSGAFGTEIDYPDGPDGTLYRAGGKDVMRVSLPDAQASRQIFDEGGVVQMKATATPLVGQAIVYSGARTDQLVTGTVTDDWLSWISDTANPDITVWGSDASWTTLKGDSGAPVYRRVFVTSPVPGWQITPVGLNSNAQGNFARAFDGTQAWGLTMFNQ